MLNIQAENLCCYFLPRNDQYTIIHIDMIDKFVRFEFCKPLVYLILKSCNFTLSGMAQTVFQVLDLWYDVKHEELQRL